MYQVTITVEPTGEATFKAEATTLKFDHAVTATAAAHRFMDSHTTTWEVPEDLSEEELTDESLLLSMTGTVEHDRWPDCQAYVVVRKVTDESCVHEGLFADSPRFGEPHEKYLNRTRHCRNCGANVPNKDL